VLSSKDGQVVKSGEFYGNIRKPSTMCRDGEQVIVKEKRGFKAKRK